METSQASLLTRFAADDAEERGFFRLLGNKSGVRLVFRVDRVKRDKLAGWTKHYKSNYAEVLI